MKPLTLLGFVAIISLLLSQTLACENVEELRNEEEANKLVDHLLSNRSKIRTSCLEGLIKRGYFKPAYRLIEEHYTAHNIDIIDLIRSVTNNMKKELDNIMALVANSKQVQTVQPVFYWAQSKSHVILQVKFAHRFDSPGCIDVKNDNVTLTDDSLRFQALCVQANHPILFALNLTFWKGIQPNISTWKYESVGRMFFNITKSESGIWRRILRDQEKPSSSQIQIWWEMKKYYAADMDEFSRMLDEEEEEREREKREKKKKSKQQQHKEKATSISEDDKVKEEQEKAEQQNLEISEIGEQPVEQRTGEAAEQVIEVPVDVTIEKEDLQINLQRF